MKKINSISRKYFNFLFLGNSCSKLCPAGLLTRQLSFSCLSTKNKKSVEHPAADVTFMPAQLRAKKQGRNQKCVGAGGPLGRVMEKMKLESGKTKTFSQ